MSSFVFMSLAYFEEIIHTFYFREDLNEMHLLRRFTFENLSLCVYFRPPHQTKSTNQATKNKQINKQQQQNKNRRNFKAKFISVWIWGSCLNCWCAQNISCTELKGLSKVGTILWKVLLEMCDQPCFKLDSPGSSTVISSAESLLGTVLQEEARVGKETNF